MTERSEQLAKGLEQSNAEFISMVEGLTDEQWHAPVANEHRTVAITAHHVATGLVSTVGAMSVLANGQTFPVTQEMFDQAAIQHIHDHAGATKDEVLGILRTDVNTATGMLRAFTDEQLDTAGSVAVMGGQMVPAGVFAQYVVLGHISDHTKNIKEALGI